MDEGVLKYQKGTWVLAGEREVQLDTKKCIDMKIPDGWRKCSMTVRGDMILVDEEVIITPELAQGLEAMFRQYDINQ